MRKKLSLILLLVTVSFGTGILLSSWGEATNNRDNWTVTAVGAIPTEWGALVTFLPSESGFEMVFQDKQGTIRIVNKMNTYRASKKGSSAKAVKIIRN